MMGHSSASSFSQYRRQADRTHLADAAASRITALRQKTAVDLQNESANVGANGGANAAR